MFWKWAFIFVLIHTTTLFAWAWKDAQEQLLAHNVKILEAKRDSENAQLEFLNQRSYHFPDLELRAGSERYLQEDATLGYRSYIGPRISWNLYQGGYVNQKRRLYRLRAFSTNNQLTQTQKEQIKALRIAYSKALYSKDYYSLVLSFVERSKTNYRIVSLKYKAGKEEQWVFLTAETGVKKDEFQVERAKFDQEIALGDLVKLLGPIPINNISQVENRGFYEMDPPIPENWEDQLNQHPKIIQAQFQKEDDQLEIKIARSSLLPILGFRTDFVLIDTEERSPIPFWYAGITFSTPLYEGGRNRRNVTIAKNEFQFQTQNQIQVFNEVKQEIQQKIFDYRAGINNMDLAKQELEAARNRFKVAQKKYEMGLMSYDDWDRTQDILKNKEISMIKNRNELNIRRAELELALGFEL